MTASLRGQGEDIAVDASRSLLCVHPHPDDESIATGGVLARAADRGATTVVVTCTGGEEGENLAGIDLEGQSLTDHRRVELADALAALKVTRSHRLGYRDSGMVGSAANEHPDSFAKAPLEEAASALAAIIRAERPEVVVSDDAMGTYGHPDHIKAHYVTVRAVALAADADADVAGQPWQVRKRYVHTTGRGSLLQMHLGLLAQGLASPFGDEEVQHAEDLPFGVEDSAVTTEVNVLPWLADKQAAMRAHRSQIGEDSFFLNTPDELTQLAFGVEQFVLEDTTIGAETRPETDLFAGL